MRKSIVSFLPCLLSLAISAQTLEISGNVQDTATKTPLQYAVAIAVSLKDSTLVKFTRTNKEGYFKLKTLPVDTYEVILSSPGFGDKTFIVAGSRSNLIFDFGKIILPPADVSLSEVIVYAYKDPIYFKGDTLVYVADSFKVKPNATVEDLLKKLPGIRVDEQGKITSQGQTVDQVLVDGDEFFGSDPTIATRNLNANTLESVQVYDKKNDNPSGEEKETLKVMDLRLKEESKKGYFGKISGAGDFSKYYEGELLVNKFKNKQKISVFGLGSNTPRTGFNFQDSYKYGLDNERNFVESDNGMYAFSRDDYSAGIPQTLKTGFYYNDKIFGKTKLMINYNYRTTETKTTTESTTQYFLTDSSYSTKNTGETQQKNQSHQLILAITQPLDSLTDLEIKPRITLSDADNNSSGFTGFFNNENLLMRSTDVVNTNKTETQNLENKTRIFRRFKKRERTFSVEHWIRSDENVSEGLLLSENNAGSLLQSTHQQKNKKSGVQSQNVFVNYFEPLNKKIKLGFNYSYFYTLGNSDASSLDIDSNGVETENPLYTNIFENKKQIHVPGIRYIYELKKYRLEAGLNYRLLYENNRNITTEDEISQSLDFFLPFINYRYKFSENSSLNARYSTNARQPEISQLQPVPDNTNPNQVKEGNPGLKPMYINMAGVNFYSYKPISKRYINWGINVVSTSNAIAYNIRYDSLGRTISTPVNVNGNYNGSANADAWFPLVKDLLSLGNRLQFSYRNNNSIINNQKNITRESTVNAGLNIYLTKEPLTFSVGANAEYRDPYSSVNPQSNNSYVSQGYNASIELDFPKKFAISTDARYSENSKRTDGYNINYIIWNAALSKSFLKTENLIVSVNAFDLLNQNINASRTISDNQVTDTKNNAVKRYVLLKVVFKFNNNKIKEEDGF